MMNPNQPVFALSGKSANTNFIVFDVVRIHDIHSLVPLDSVYYVKKFLG